MSIVVHGAGAAFNESKGIVVMEAESTRSSLGKWKKKTDVDGFTGTGHLEFTGNKPENGPPDSPLEYTFKIHRGGNYTLAIRAHKRLISKRQDICNDCYVEMKGDFRSGNDTPLQVLKKETKMFGGRPKGWGYAVQLDVKHKTHTPVYRFKADQTYTLTISGRSKNFNIDRIILVHEDSNLKKIQHSLPAESKLEEGARRRPTVAKKPAREFKKVSTKPVITGEGKQWHKVTMTFDGPATSERAVPNPFTDYRMDVKFSHDKKTLVVPGYFAADGDAANSSADSGNKWRVHFSPPFTGKWSWRVSFRKGSDVATADQLSAGASAGYFDQAAGRFTIAKSDKKTPDLRARGRLAYVGKRYPRTLGDGKIFFKAGADAPENFLAYRDFDGDFKSDGEKDHLIKTWQPHVRDWRRGDPTWAKGKGKGMIGAVNYLASKGMNAVSFLTMNIGGDDRNVFPYLNTKMLDRLDVSRLAQWEVVFKHASNSGLFLHFKTQETENETLLDWGDTGRERRLYYRELVARFGHHPALNWNMGEENGSWRKNKKNHQNTRQRLAMARYLKAVDPYDHPIVIHNGQWFDD
ncbi:MAG: DUF5060 domain-containing protein, partial [Verrucomicrobiae bacterium]|nr:DUF5060 domain-containing protein [Verrucomicrobiae bacterium]